MAQTLLDQFLMAVAAGLVTGHSPIRKWGNNSAISTTEEDIWSAGGVYTFPSNTGESLEVVSAGADTAEITIEGLGKEFGAQKETVTLNGTTPVAIPGIWTRVNRAYNSDSSAFANLVIVRKVAGATYAHLAVSHQQTSQAIYTIPAGCTGLVLTVNGSVNRTGTSSLAADYFLNVREFGKVFRKKWHAGVQKDGSSLVVDKMILPEKLLEKTDVKMSGIAQTTDVSGSAWFYILLLTNSKIPGLSNA
jgi:hypothetical protein